MAVSIIFTSLATSFVIARLYTRIKLMKRMEANDWMIVIALVSSYTYIMCTPEYSVYHKINLTEQVFSFVFMGLFIAEAVNGMGMHGAAIPAHILVKQMKVAYHQSALPQSSPTNRLQAFWATIPFYNAAVLCAKATILMQYFRVFPTHRMRVICWTMIAVLATYGTWCVLSAFLNCIPVAKFWNPAIPGHCLSKPGLWFSNASMHIATDLAILIIPIPALAALDLPKRQKVALFVIFALGGLLV